MSEPSLTTARRRRPTPRPRPTPGARTIATDGPSPAGPADTATAPPPAGRPRRVGAAALRAIRAIGLLPAILAALVLVATVGVALLYLRQHDTDQVEAARAAALQSARERVPQVLSYSATALDKDLAAGLAATTGRFHRELADLQRTVIRPSATTERISTRTTVSDAGVVRGTDQQMVVLAFINQSTTSQKQSTPRLDGARLRVTMQHAGDAWLVAGVDPV